ncbi:MAG: response regulator [Leptospiraceae bacterium]|nr:response regulator [Leptospiraceae bacterium]
MNWPATASRVKKRGILILLTLSILTRFSCDAPDRQRSIEAGYIDLANYSFQEDGPLELRGEWIILWNRLLMPAEAQNVLSRLPVERTAENGPRFMKLPGRWNGHPIDGGRTAPGIGHATFALRYSGLSGDDMHRLAFRMKDALSSYRIYIVDDKLGPFPEPIMSNGIVAQSEEKAVPQHLPLVRPLPSGLTDGWILLQVANFHDSVGGPIYPLRLGTEEQLLGQREQKRAQDFLVLGVLLVMGLYHLGLATQRSRDRASLWFALFNGVLAARLLLTEKYVQEWLGPPNELFFELLQKADYATAFILVPLFFSFLRRVFLGPIIGKLEKPAWILTLLFLCTLFWPQRSYSSVATYYYIWALLLSIWVLAGMVAAIRRKELGARISFAGLLIVFLAGINDALLADGQISGAYILPYGFILFVVAQSYILIRRFSHAFNTAEHLSQYLQKEVQNQTRELEEKNRALQDVTHQRTIFFQNISHELRTPLTLIYGPLESMRSGEYGPVGPSMSGALGSMMRNARQLLRLINQLLDLSRIEAGHVQIRKETVPISSLLEDVARSFQEFGERKEIRLELNIAGSFYCSGDAEKLEKVFYNLISNAFKYTPRGGSVTITLDASETEVIIRVADTGPGIPREDREKIFHRFYQVDGSRTRQQEGSGIGLSIVKEFVDLHGGRLELESEVGRGSRFTVALDRKSPEGNEPPSEPEPHGLYRGDGGRSPIPLVESQESSPFRSAQTEESGDISSAEGQGSGLPANPSASNQEQSANMPTILVVEDSEDMRNFISHVLQGKYNIALAENGREGLEIAARIRPDLILSDVMMPEMDGPEMLRRIRESETLRETPSVLLSARLDTEPEQGEQLADFYLAKPFRPEELREAVMGFLSGGKQG